MYKTNYLESLSKLPLTLLLIISILCCSGFIILYSAAGGSIYPWSHKQIINFCLFMPFSILIAILDLRIIFKFSYLFYFLILLLLIGVEVFGTIAMGAKRWIDFGFTRVQPSEPAKLAIVLMLAKYFHQLSIIDLTKISKLCIAVIGVVIPVILIIKQPDLGTGVITLIVAGFMFFAAGVRLWKFIVIGASIMLSLPIIWHLMYDYQRKRVLVFFDPEKDPLNAGYNIIQSKIAIGSGGIFGKGLMNGTQSHLSFLPEHQTDFIFATFAEEFGFAGGIWLLTLYSLIISICLTIVVNTKSIFGKLIVVGVTAIFFSHVFINIAMVMGMLPAVGVPLPFISYGGTMMASMLIGFGLVMNVQVHRHINL
ncbi:Rod shape-determining protein RodA [Candidatus Trichorickettsia mobilis]|uniref:Peptidoglycan glycosyltransferase MrdB n=1 Tax=Candidatus Trichorickettsia mobilis TaxID=1346319 RepID=A0ABZ0UV06_9RICK|nr:rod shape-determining protein RodA [Candidatus Trichorickettsia mobilis]WPY01331.1 Rod shape-determining protein RodA [Candidatus Trichorickettsia mobilis]